ncbi:forkhead box protein J1-B [Caerostris darwini]|uniref:Forkhead box protein J1-B n=1 Tax=Caerostris darwini TaxID=1538125 RepID=A0AAV4NZX2_9ARAC|nr:forkhead box protein J1-B [Caerostris darwini]
MLSTKESYDPHFIGRDTKESLLLHRYYGVEICSGKNLCVTKGRHLLLINSAIQIEEWPLADEVRLHPKDLQSATLFDEGRTGMNYIRLCDYEIRTHIKCSTRGVVQSGIIFKVGYAKWCVWSAPHSLFPNGGPAMTFSMPMVSKDEMALRFHQNWRDQNTEDLQSDADDCLTDLNWLQNLNIMTKFGAPTPDTPPASPPAPCPDSGKGSLLYRGAKGGHMCSSSSRAAPQAEDVDYKTNGAVKPPYSYATLICMAMKANENKMTLSAIYKWIKENFMYYRNADPSWQVSASSLLRLVPTEA